MMDLELRYLLTRAVRDLKRMLAPHSQVLMIAWDDPFAGTEPQFAAEGNCTGYATLIHAMLAEITKAPRPADCEACAAAWDAMVEARLKLDPANRPDVACR